MTTDSAASSSAGKVLIMLNGDLVGGVEVWALTYGTRSRDGGDYQPVFLSLKEGGFRPRAEQRDLDLHCLTARGPFDLALVGRVARLIREQEIDLVHTHTVRANFVGRLAARRAGVPVISHIHSRTLDETANHLKNWFNWRYDRLTEKLTDHFIFVAPSLERDYPAVASTVIPNGVDPMTDEGPRRDLRPELGIPQGAPVFGCIAVLRARKGVDDLIHAAEIVTHRVPDAHCLIVGSEAEPGYVRRLQEIAQQVGVADRVHFVGYRDDVPDVLHTLDLLCLPSIYGEGLPLIVLEALFASRPVVATRVEGTALAVRDGETGWLVEPRNASGLADRISRLLLDAELRAQMGARGRADAHARFTPERMIRDMHSVYDRVLAQHRQRATPEVVL